MDAQLVRSIDSHNVKTTATVASRVPDEQKMALVYVESIRIVRRTSEEVLEQSPWSRWCIVRQRTSDLFCNSPLNARDGSDWRHTRNGDQNDEN